MATYKVIQDIEAEDKLLGPLTLRQFIYAIIVVVQAFIVFKLAFVKWFLALPFLPSIVLFGVLAAPFGHDQPSEVWLLAKIRFFLKPRRRVWDQSGAKHLVTITAPPKIDKHYTNDLSQTEVKSRLRALADTIDSRGWAVKNVNVNLTAQPAWAVSGAVPSDRLIGPDSLPREVSSVDVTAQDDIMDPRSNPLAEQLDAMMQTAAQSHREQVLQRMQGRNGGAPPATPGSQQAPNDYWFMHQPDPAQLPGPGYAAFGPQTVPPATSGPPDSTPATGDMGAEEQALLERLRQQQQSSQVPYGRMKVINPLGAQPANQPQPPAVTPAPDPAILGLANNDDLDVATIAREAKRSQTKQPPADEVVINLH